MGWIEQWIKASPYAAALGLGVVALEAERAALALDFTDEISNGDKGIGRILPMPRSRS
jgi:hypothetical protein